MLSCEHNQFNCSGTPQPEVSVLKDGVPVDLANDHVQLVKKGDQCTVNIKNATESDTGEYTICATNSEGTVEQKVKVSVQP